MKRTLFPALILFYFMGLINAQEPGIAGSWLLERAEADGEIQEPYFVSEFQNDGTMLIMGMEVGTWKFNKKSNSIVMQSDFDEDFSGEMRILNPKTLKNSTDQYRLSA